MTNFLILYVTIFAFLPTTIYRRTSLGNLFSIFRKGKGASFWCPKEVGLSERYERSIHMKARKRFSRVVASTLTLALLLGMLPMAAFAAGDILQKIKADFSKATWKGAKCKPLEEHSSGACLSVCVYKRVRLK